MYVNITGSSNNKDVYIYQSYRKENSKTSSHIFKKLLSPKMKKDDSMYVISSFSNYAPIY